MRINWFTPLPPARTDIANFSVRVLPHLQRLADVVVWTTRGKQLPVPDGPETYRLYDPGAPDWAEMNRADLSFFNIGNNGVFHSWMLDLAWRVPGVLILHDTLLKDLCLHYSREWSRTMRAARRRATLLLNHTQSPSATGELGNRAQLEVASDDMAGVSAVAANALGIVVHSKMAERAISERLDVPVVSLPLPYPAVAVPPRRPPHTEPRRLIVFGFLGANRCLDDVVQAIATHPQRNCFRLDLYGELLDRNRFRATVKRFQLESRVAHHGFVSDADLDSAIASAHLAINLRWPTMGEASGSQLRIWSQGTPAVVTRVGWYSELPEEVVAFVSPDKMESDLKGHLSRLLTHPEHFDTIARRGHDYVRRLHTSEQYAANIASIVERRRHLYAQYTARSVCDSIAVKARPWINRRTMDACAGSIAGKIAHACLVAEEELRGEPVQAARNLEQPGEGRPNVRGLDGPSKKRTRLGSGGVLSHRPI